MHTVRVEVTLKMKRPTIIPPKQEIFLRIFMDENISSSRSQIPFLKLLFDAFHVVNDYLETLRTRRMSFTRFSFYNKSVIVQFTCCNIDQMFFFES